MTFNWQPATDTMLDAGETSRKLFFFDESLPDGARNVRHVYGPVTKHGVVLPGDEGSGFLNARTFCGSIVRVAPLHYRLYYTVSGERGMRIAVAETNNFRDWDLPRLAQEQREGFPPNVIAVAGAPDDILPAQPANGSQIAGTTLTTADGRAIDTASQRSKADQVGQPQVVRLPDGRWRMYYWHHQHGWGRVPYLYTIAESVDGITWTVPDYSRPALNSHWLGDQSALSQTDALAEKGRRTNDANFVYWNPRLGVYEQFSQWFLNSHPDKRVEEDNCPDFNRMIQRRVSADGLTFSAPELVVQADGRDPWDLQFYHLAVQYHEDWYVGSLGHYRVENEQQTTDVELAFSRDGRHWQRPVRGGFIPRDSGSPDSEAIHPPNAWVAEDDKWLCLYTGSNRKHNGPKQSDRPSSHSMLASFSVDRLVGIRANRPTGGFLSPVFFPQADSIRLDAVVRGWLRAELCDAWGRKLPGYHLADSVPVFGDDTDHILRWREQGTGGFRHDPVRVRFEFADAEVYCLKF